MSANLSVTYFALLSLSIYLVHRVFRTWNRLPLPPGPRPLPLVGNILDMPKFYEWYTYHEWNKKYGELQAKSQTR